MLPIVVKTPVIHTNNTDGLGSYYERLEKSGQKPPYNVPAPYKVCRVVTTKARLLGETTSFGGMANAGAYTGDYLCAPDESPPCLEGYIDRAKNNARAKLVDQVRKEAMLAVNYYERKQAASMLSSRLFQMARFTAALRSGRVIDAARALHLNPQNYFSPKGYNPKRGWRSIKDFGDAYLEYHFGLEPLIGDIFSCVEILTTVPNPNPFTVKGKRVAVSAGFTQKGGSPFYETYERKMVGYVSSKAGATIRVRDAEAYKLASLGLVNPATFILEIIPFSFLLDWVSNLSDFLGQWTDFVGLDVIDPWYGYTVNVTSTYSYTYIASGINGRMVEKTGFYSPRILGIPSVTLKATLPPRISLTRAATAISLLLQGLKGSKGKS